MCWLETSCWLARVEIVAERSLSRQENNVHDTIIEVWLLVEANGQIMSATLFRLVDGLKSILWNLCHCKYIVHLSDIQKAFCPC